MRHAGFLQKLQTYDKDNIPVEVITRIKPYIDNPQFDPDVVAKASKAAYGLVCWVRAMEAYDRSAVAQVLALAWVCPLKDVQGGFLQALCEPPVALCLPRRWRG